MNAQDEMVLRSSKWKQLRLLLLCVGFVAMGVFLIAHGEWIGYLCAGFFGLGVLMFAMQLLTDSSYLVLGKDGFEYRVMFRRGSARWKDIAGFGVIVQKQLGITTNTMVGWDFMPDYEASAKSRAFSKRMAGVEAGLPDTYGMKAEELARLMEEYWLAYQARSIGDASPADSK